MRYVWDASTDYFHYGDPLRVRRAILALATGPLRAWDRACASGVDHFIANSRNVKERITRHYGRSADVVYPPIDTDFFTPGRNGAGGFYLVVSALVPPKRLDLAIDAFNRLGRPLVVAGCGPDLESLRRRAAPHIRFAGRVSDDALRELYRGCRALVVAGREDFGMTAVEAQACGRPVVAYAAGGALESIIDGETGILFANPSASDLAEAILRCERTRFDGARLRASAERFSTQRFRAGFREALERAARRGACSPPLVRPEKRAGRDAPRHRSLVGLPGLAKRALDIGLSVAGLAAFGLPIALLAALIRLGSPGPAFFFQRRVGLGGREFRIIKLRTMLAGAEPGGVPTWAVADDPRCTPLGGFLRRYGLDELPQLWNVLKGEMSLVGPRPERPEFIEKFEASLPGYRSRLAARAGITGLAQVRGFRGDTSLEARLRADLEYIARWSLGKDLAILLVTPLALGRRNRRARAGADCPAKGN